MDTIELKLDEGNELEFQVVVEGASGISRVRLVIEDKALALSFDGSTNSSGNVAVSLPSLKQHLSEGVYPAKLEVIAENRYFEPLAFSVDLRETVKVTSASVLTVNESRVKTATKPSAPIAVAKLVSQDRETSSPVRLNENETVTSSPEPTRGERITQRSARGPVVRRAKDDEDLNRMIDRILRRAR